MQAQNNTVLDVNDLCPPNLNTRTAKVYETICAPQHQCRSKYESLSRPKPRVQSAKFHLRRLDDSTFCYEPLYLQTPISQYGSRNQNPYLAAFDEQLGIHTNLNTSGPGLQADIRFEANLMGGVGKTLLLLESKGLNPSLGKVSWNDYFSAQHTLRDLLRLRIQLDRQLEVGLPEPSFVSPLWPGSEYYRDSLESDANDLLVPVPGPSEALTDLASGDLRQWIEARSLTVELRNLALEKIRLVRRFVSRAAPVLRKLILRIYCGLGWEKRKSPLMHAGRPPNEPPALLAGRIFA